MKKNYILIAFLIIFQNTNSQMEFVGRVIKENNNIAVGAKFVLNADVHNDGDTDLIYSSNSDGVRWIENDGGIDVNSVSHLITDDVMIEIDAGDLDGDGDIDLVLNRDSVLYYYENVDGEGDFSSFSVLDQSNTYLKVEIIDIDQDNDLDIVYNERWSSSYHILQWLENTNGNGTLERKIIHEGEQHFSFSVKDVDNDADLDIVASRQNDRSFRLYRNDGEDSFSEEFMFTTAYSGICYFDIDDLDQDGDLDMTLIQSDTTDGTFFFTTI